MPEAARREQVADSESLEVMRTRIADQNKTIAEKTARETELQTNLETEVGRRVAADEAAVANTIAAATAETNRLEAEYARLAEEGKFGEMAKINTQLTDARLQLSTATAAKGRIESWKRQAVEEAKVAATRQPPAETPKFSAATQAWLDKHPDIVPFGAGWTRAQGAHFTALGENLQQDTPEYFEFLDKHLGYKKADAATTEEPLSEASRTIESNGMEIEVEQPNGTVVPLRQAERIVAREAPVVDAGRRGNGGTAIPPSRSQPNLNGGRSGRDNQGRVRLTQGEAEAAYASRPDLVAAGKGDEALAEYAKNKLELQAEGRL